MLIVISLVTLSLNSKQRINQEATESVSDYDVQVVGFKQLKPLLHMDNDTIYVVNFWATWCAPCIREVPYFEQLREEYKGEKLKIIMVSLDFSEDLDSRVIPFMRKHNMQNEVILLDDPQSNLWIPLVDEKWTGAIPATLIYGNGFREFHAKEFTFSELDEIIESLISN